MAEPTSNDNVNLPPHALQGPDAHGQAAMLLVESLIHGLVAKSVISAAEAIEIVDVAIDVEEEMAVDLGDSRGTTMKSISLLTAISISLAN